jgi:hypothetical protein
LNDQNRWVKISSMNEVGKFIYNLTDQGKGAMMKEAEELLQYVIDVYTGVKTESTFDEDEVEIRLVKMLGLFRPSLQFPRIHGHFWR